MSSLPHIVVLHSPVRVPKSLFYCYSFTRIFVVEEMRLNENTLTLRDKILPCLAARSPHVRNVMLAALRCVAEPWRARVVCRLVLVVLAPRAASSSQSVAGEGGARASLCWFSATNTPVSKN